MADTDTFPSYFGCAIEGGGTNSDFHTFDLTICDDNYSVQTNPWGGATQTITAGGDAVFTVVSMQEPAGGEDWDVAAFPSVYRGTAQGGNPTTDSGMPARVGDITSVLTGLSTNALSTTYTGNTTYDVYFTDSPTYTGGGPDTYLMVWFHAFGMNPITTGGYTCGADPPLYTSACTEGGTVTFRGKEFVRFVGTNWTTPVISYLPVTRMETWEFDLNDFIADAVEQGVISDDMYLQSIQAGFELISGGAGLTVNEFYAVVE
jgi:hypothetical protein